MVSFSGILAVVFLELSNHLSQAPVSSSMFSQTLPPNTHTNFELQAVTINSDYQRLEVWVLLLSKPYSSANLNYFTASTFRD